MKNIHLEDAFAPEPAMVHARVERTLREATTMTKKHFCTKTLAFALALALMLCSVAYAAVTGGVLDYVFRGGKSAPTEQQRNLVQPICAGETAGGVTVTVTEAIFDGRRLDLGVQVDTDQPTWVEVVSLTLDGEAAVVQSAYGLFMPIAQSMPGGLTAVTEERITKDCQAEMHIRLLDRDPYLGEPYKELGQMGLALPVKATAQAQHLTLGAHGLLAEITLENAWYTEMSTAFDVRISPIEGGMTQQEISDTYLWFECFDEQHQPLSFQDTWYQQDSFGTDMPDGSWYYLIECVMPAMERVPGTIWLVPCSHEYPAGQWELAIPLKPEK